jgi:hypothetical protein
VGKRRLGSNLENWGCHIVCTRYVGFWELPKILRALLTDIKARVHSYNHEGVHPGYQCRRMPRTWTSRQKLLSFRTSENEFPMDSSTVKAAYAYPDSEPGPSIKHPHPFGRYRASVPRMPPSAGENGTRSREERLGPASLHPWCGPDSRDLPEASFWLLLGIDNLQGVNNCHSR